MRSLTGRSLGLCVALAMGTGTACTSNPGHTPPAGTGGNWGSRGSATGGISSTGGIQSSGGAAGLGGTANAGGTHGSGGAATGGTPGTGGLAGSSGTSDTGGTSSSTTGGNPTGGSTTQPGTGGNPTGGSTTQPGTGGMGGSSGTGTGGDSSGTGGRSGTAGSSNDGGAGGDTCPFPTSFQWSSSGPLAQPKSPAGHTLVSLKDFTNVVHNGQHIVYATAFDSTASWTSLVILFQDWPDFASAPQTWMGNLTVGSTVAPTLFYFTPKDIWVLITQWGIRYATSTDPTDPSKWSALQPGLTGGPGGEIDPTVICDSTDCYLFFATSNGQIHRSSMQIGQFPGAFSGSTPIINETKATVNEAVQVYAVKGTGKYLMFVESDGWPRYFRAYSADSLGGTFTAIPGASTRETPFAGKSNVTFTGAAWTDDISHGDMVRSDPSETQTIDPCNMQLLYQGRDPSQNPKPYEQLAFLPGLLTLTQ
ncbi:MAG: hypothetical protein JW751_04055 [Polyangiaceae bacterium]|nr:hypothetical protein [Polyangiaceae bacterium]